jgi:hypothetical protein
MIFSEDRFPPRIKSRIKSGAGFFGIMLYPPGDGASEGASEGTKRLFSRRVGTAR